MNKCLNCKLERRQSHFNSKYCLKCKKYLKRKPKSSLTQFQIKKARSLIGKIPREVIAAELNTSLANLKRAFRGTRLAYYNRYVINPSLVKKVCEFYGRNGLIKSKEKFPDVNIRSIVDRYKLYKPRQIRWTDEQKIELIKMSCFIPLDTQYKHFNRPRAFEGSIKSAWEKTLKLNKTQIHGMPLRIARFLMEGKYNNVCIKNYEGFKIVLWGEIDKHLAEWVPMEIKKAIKLMAQFQEKLYGGSPKEKIKQMIKEFGVKAY